MESASLLAIAGLPLLLVGLAMFPRKTSALATLGVFAAALQLIAAGLSSYFINEENLEALWGWLRLDPLGCVFSLFIAISALSAILYEEAHWSMLPPEEDATEENKQIKLRRLFWLWSAASLIPLVSGFILLWGAFAFLLLCTTATLSGSPEDSRRYALRAWLALSVALLGVLFFFWAATKANATEDPFAFSVFFERASSLDDALISVGSSLAFLGFGFFAGVWPGQGLLLETQQKLSAPKSLFFSTAIWSASIYALLRVLGLSAKATGFSTMSSLLLLFGGLTVVSSVLAFRMEGDGKRWLGHLMTAHTGLLLFVLGFSSRFITQSALFLSFFWLLSRGLLWLSLGSIMTRRQTTELSMLVHVSTRSHRRMLILAFAACLGVPPLGTFIAQWALLHATALELQQPLSAVKVSGLLGALWFVVLYWRVWLLLGALALITAKVLRIGVDLLTPRELPEPPSKQATPVKLYLSFGFLCFLLVALGVVIPEFIDSLFDQAARVVTGEWSEH